jgi:hypothetical protein
MSAWTGLSGAEEDEIWDRFCLRFAFRASVRPDAWPGIREPSPFVTWAIPDPWPAAATDELHACALAAFRAVLGHGERMFALDWQHPCWWFAPHESVERWEVPVLPNGDYFIFLSPELEWGWFGHPWEQSICVFGAPLIAALDQNPPAMFSRILRQG